jgi:pyridoxal phosphate enzyme (YggS family)
MTISQNLAAVRSRIATAQKACVGGQNVTLLAVAKGHDAAAVAAAIDAGQRDFGENRVQEAKGKYPPLRTAYPDMRLHLIGPLQTNKVRDAVALFDVIHTLDRPELAEKLAREMARQQRFLPCFLQVNIGAEPQKAGVLLVDFPMLLSRCRALGLDIVGLMAIPPADADPQPHFAALRDLAAQHGLQGLSMGMSSDYETAIAHGATHVRVGTAIFGGR